ncbi:MAG: hypothetical protein K0R61_3282 [Microvirga sp.]|jgi:hypothetical protein|nr:hypothetical protein [Microvirga sp.]
MQFQAQFVRFRTEDNRPVPIAFPVQVIAPDAEQAMGKLKRLASGCRGP